MLACGKSKRLIIYIPNTIGEDESEFFLFFPWTANAGKPVAVIHRKHRGQLQLKLELIFGRVRDNVRMAVAQFSPLVQNANEPTSGAISKADVIEHPCNFRISPIRTFLD